MAHITRREDVVLGRKKPTEQEKRELRRQLIVASLASRNARETLRVMLRARQNKEHAWKDLELVPPDSFVDTACAAFQDCTDIPLEAPFFTAMGLISSFFLSKDVQIQLGTQRISTALWTLLLAPSGMGKTFVAQRLMETGGFEVPLIPDSASAAKFIENLSENNGGLWLRDEIGEFFQSLEQRHMSDIKGYLLQAYDGVRLSRSTKGGSIVIERPRMAILGYTVDETWRKSIRPELLLNGFCQRFNFVVVARRNCPIRAIYDLSAWSDRLRDQWRRLEQAPLHPVYRVSAEAIAAFEEAFKQMWGSAQEREVPGSFFRRIMFSGLRYALVYHVLLRKRSDCIDEVDIGWAARVVRRHLQDVAKMLDEFGMNDLEPLVRKVEELIARARNRGAAVSPRDICRTLPKLVNARDARALLELALYDDPNATAEEVRLASGGRRLPGSATTAGNGSTIGTQGRSFPRSPRQRFIPAPAGNAADCPDSPDQGAARSRAYGEFTTSSLSSSDMACSPPPRAGSTSFFELLISRRTVHRLARGELASSELVEIRGTRRRAGVTPKAST